mmetsp:Transcript_28717/g.86855  ORF Transcript_28717/g.86855 Transcript_28717/m.86855 type:complete len:204 (+) Transcript_28717:1163-1774(+)
MRLILRRFCPSSPQKRHTQVSAWRMFAKETRWREQHLDLSSLAPSSSESFWTSNFDGIVSGASTSSMFGSVRLGAWYSNRAMALATSCGSGPSDSSPPEKSACMLANSLIKQSSSASFSGTYSPPWPVHMSFSTALSFCCTTSRSARSTSSASVSWTASQMSLCVSSEPRMDRNILMTKRGREISPKTDTLVRSPFASGGSSK